MKTNDRGWTLKIVKILCGCVIVMAAGAGALPGGTASGSGLPSGPFTPGFRLILTSDTSRSYPSGTVQAAGTRPMRIYVWYPAKPSSAPRMKFDDYVRLALEDFRPSALPLPLARGLDAGALEALRASPVGAVKNAEAGTGRYPVIVFGQGLFFESPLSNFVLCEYLASHGYIVTTSPLLGTQDRLVNIDIEDLETEVRDMAFAAAEALELPIADPGRLGVIGFDLGGMAGLLLTMRDLRVGAFLSLDSGILDRHYTGLPATHPQYREAMFRVPWMHLTQDRFIRPEKDRAEKPSLFERKAYGPSYLVHVPTSNHGDFSSYAGLGVAAEGPGLWSGPPEAGDKPLYEGICRTSLAFFDAHLLGARGRLEESLQAGADAGGPGFRIEHKTGSPAPPSESALVDLIINRGIAGARPEIERVRVEHPGVELIAESVLNWLGAHFLYWWGREDEAVGVFELMVFLYPESWSAYDSLGEANADRGRKDEAIRSYRRSLELNPQNQNAKSALEKLTAPVKKAASAAD
jgi:dienelactone hydrolase